MINDSVYKETGVLKLVHPGGLVEIHKYPITAAEVMKRNPRHCVTRPDVFKFPWIVVRPESVLKLGRVFYVVPYHTLHRLLQSKGSRNRTQLPTEDWPEDFTESNRFVDSIGQYQNKLYKTQQPWNQKSSDSDDFSPKKQHSVEHEYPTQKTNPLVQAQKTLMSESDYASPKKRQPVEHIKTEYPAQKSSPLMTHNPYKSNNLILSNGCETPPWKPGEHGSPGYPTPRKVNSGVTRSSSKSNSPLTNGCENLWDSAEGLGLYKKLEQPKKQSHVQGVDDQVDLFVEERPLCSVNYDSSDDEDDGLHSRSYDHDRELDHLMRKSSPKITMLKSCLKKPNSITKKRSCRVRFALDEDVTKFGLGLGSL